MMVRRAWETQCGGEEDVLEEGEESPGIIPPVTTPPQPETKERHAYRHKATDRFSDCISIIINTSTMSERTGIREGVLPLISTSGSWMLMPMMRGWEKGGGVGLGREGGREEVWI